ncbi:MAG: VWA domain-containing protein [Anaerolineae bacterium]|jgi:hypothetical protein|nr:VWA domain-containing protein [Anaerolineae bacterium]
MSDAGPYQRQYLPPEEDYQGGHLLHNLLLFGRVCRALGLAITPGCMMDVARALAHIDLGRRQDVFCAMQALMVTQRKDLPLFAEAFQLFWRRPADGQITLNLFSLGEQRHKRKTQFLPPAGSEPDDPASPDGLRPDPSLIAIVPTYSQTEVLRYKDFAAMTGAELRAAQAMIARLPRALSFRRSRRYRAGHGRGRQPDLRRSLRQALRTGGELLRLPARHKKIRPRPLVLLCDISGSMERYTRVLLHFMHTLAQHLYQVESFVFSTQLSRITHPIRQTSVDVALRDVGTSVQHWGAGTRTGEALHSFNYQWARRVLGRGAIVLLITDGWDRGEPALLHQEMQRLQRQCFRLIWLNPLLGSAAYEPLTRGAQAMLPFVDAFLPVHNLASLAHLMDELARVQGRR